MGTGGEVVDEEERGFGAAVACLTADVFRELVAEDVEEGEEDRQLRNQGDARGKGIDFVLFVDAHHFLLHALFVVFVLLLQLFDLRLQRLQRSHPLQLFVGEGDQHRPRDDGEGDDRHAPTEAHAVVEELQDRVRKIDQRLQDVGGGKDHEWVRWYSAGWTGQVRGLNLSGKGSKPP